MSPKNKKLLLDIAKDALYFDEGADFEFYELVGGSKRWQALKEIYQARFPNAFLTEEDEGFQHGVDEEEEAYKLYDAIKKDICTLFDSI